MVNKKRGITIKEKSSKRLSKIRKFDKLGYSLEVGIFNPGLARLGSYHEFGTSRIPRRSFLREYYTIHSSDVTNGLRKTMSDIYRGVSPDKALSKLGLTIVEGIKKRIKEKIPPELAQSTIDQKSGRYKYTPLIRTGELIRSIEYRVKKNK